MGSRRDDDLSAQAGRGVELDGLGATARREEREHGGVAQRRRVRGRVLVAVAVWRLLLEACHGWIFERRGGKHHIVQLLAAGNGHRQRSGVTKVRGALQHWLHLGRECSLAELRIGCTTVWATGSICRG